MIRISAIICTYNGAMYLPEAIQSLCDQALGREEYEIVVVDNNSTDKTREVVRTFEERYENVRYVMEREVGLSKARNAGLKQAAGKYVAYMDDDARADPDLLKEFLCVFETVKPRPACIGGGVLTQWVAPKPEWLIPRYFSLVGVSERPEDAHFTDEDQLVEGVNMAFDAELLRESGGFNNKIRYYGDEVYVVERLRRAGYKPYFAPQAFVHHIVTAQRMEKAYLCKRMFLKGRGEFRVVLERSRTTRHAQSYTVKNIVGRPLDLTRWLLSVCINRMSGSTEHMMLSRLAFSRSAGMFMEACSTLFEQMNRSKVS